MSNNINPNAGKSIRQLDDEMRNFENYYINDMSVNNRQSLNDAEDQSIFSANLDIGTERTWLFGIENKTREISFKNPKTGEVTSFNLRNVDLAVANRLMKSVDLLCKYSTEDSPEITQEELTQIQEDMKEIFGEPDMWYQYDEMGGFHETADNNFYTRYNDVLKQYTSHDPQDEQTISADEIYSFAFDLLSKFAPPYKQE